ncbi:MAG: hypothetical protein V3G42_04730 [Oscillospiraceae bacterium]
MQDLINAYRSSQASLRRRIAELNTAMKKPHISSKEKENLHARRYALYMEIYEMDDIIQELVNIQKGAMS